MKIIIYACYLPGSTTPDYIGSHQADPTPGSQYGIYVGAGAWVSRSGSLHILRSCQARPWGALLEKMTPEERLAIRVATLDIVDNADRWSAEARAIRDHRPRFNALLPQTAEEKRAKWNAYCRINSKRYYTAHPDKAQAKRAADRERIAAKRAAAKAVKDAANVA